MAETTGWVAITLGLVTAGSTIAVGLINTRKDRRDERDNLARDAELAEKLVPDSDSRKMLALHIEDQIYRLVLQGRVQRLRRIGLIIASIALGVATTSLAVQLLKNPDNVPLLLQVATYLLFASALLAGWAFLRVEKRARERLRTEFPDVDAAKVKGRALVWIHRSNRG